MRVLPHPEQTFFFKKNSYYKIKELDRKISFKHLHKSLTKKRNSNNIINKWLSAHFSHATIILFFISK